MSIEALVKGPPPSGPTASAVVSALVDTLGRNSCFVYGALVLEDPDHRVFDALRAHGYRRHTYAILPTHDALLRGRHLNPRIELKDADAQWEAALEPPLLMCRSWCVDDHCAQETSRPKRIVLFYRFETSDLRDGRRTHYTYIKPENWPYYNYHHVVDAVKRYKLGIENMGAVFPTRREDEPYARQGAETHRSDARTYYDENIRVGNEVFLSHAEYAPALAKIGM